MRIAKLTLYLYSHVSSQTNALLYQISLGRFFDFVLYHAIISSTHEQNLRPCGSNRKYNQSTSVGGFKILS